MDEPQASSRKTRGQTARRSDVFFNSWMLPGMKYIRHPILRSGQQSLLESTKARVSSDALDGKWRFKMSEVCSAVILGRATGSELWFGEYCIPTFSPFAFTISSSTKNLSRNGSMLREYEPEQAARRGSLGSSRADTLCGNILGGGSHPSTNDERGMLFGAMQSMKCMRFAEARVAMEDYGTSRDCRCACSGEVIPTEPLLCGPDDRKRGLKTWR